MTTATNLRVVNIEVRKHFERAIQEGPAMDHIAAMIAATSSPKWTLELSSGLEGSTTWYRTFGNKFPADVALYFTLTGSHNADEDLQIAERLAALSAAAMGTKNQKRNWSIHLVDGEPYKPMSPQERSKRAQERAEGMVSYAEVSIPTKEEIADAFKDMYGVDAQIARIMISMKRSIETNFRYRSHGLLIGPPGCGKSQTLTYAQSLFSEPGAVLQIDGTSMTSAGITKTLDELETMPRFVFIEEIDKAPNDAVAVLLGLMDKHGEIRKTTYRDKIAKEARVCVFGTANSLQKLRNMQEGAVLSRFGNPITYTRPSDEMLIRILHREFNDADVQMCQKNNGKQCGKCDPCKTRKQWIDITLKWCRDNHEIMATDTLDPRFVIDLAMNGQEELTGNQYLAMIEQTSIKKAELEDWD